jgi:hypothetical protein
MLTTCLKPKTIGHALLIFAVAFSAEPVLAGTGSGTVVNLTPSALSGTEFFVLTLSTMTGQPTCATSGRFALSSTAPTYRTIVAGLLGAYFSGATIFVRGLGTCDTYTGTEDIGNVCFDGGTPC